MEILRSVFPEEPDEDEVNRAMLIAFFIMVVVTGVMYMLSPIQRIRAWYNRPAILTSTTDRGTAPSGPTVADNQASNQNPPGAFVEHDGNDQDLSPDDFTKPFLRYTEQDVANMKAAWRKCLDARTHDAATFRERTSQVQAEAWNARQTERRRVAAEVRRADAAEKRVDAAEARAGKAEGNLRDHKRRFLAPPVFSHDPDDQKIIKQLFEEKEALQRQLDVCIRAKSRSIRPKEIEEYKKQLEKAQRNASDAQKRLTKEQRNHRNIYLRLDKAEKVLREHGTREGTLHHLREARATIEEQKNTIETHQVVIQSQERALEDNIAEQQDTIDRQADALRQYATADLEHRNTIKTQQEALEQYQAEAQACKNNQDLYKAEIVNLRQTRENAIRELQGCHEARKQLQERFENLHEEFEDKDTRLEESENNLADAYRSRNQDISLNRKLKSEITGLEAEADTKDAMIKRLQKRIVDFREGGRGPSACENCKTLQGQITLLQDSQKSQQASFEQRKKQFADVENQLKEAKSLLGSNMTVKAQYYIKKAQAQTKAVKADRDKLQNTLKGKDEEIKKLTDDMNALETGKSTDSDCDERCKKLQAEIENLKAATAAIECEQCTELQAEVDRLNEYKTTAPPNKRVLQLIERDAKIKDRENKIKALQEELGAAKANTGGADLDEIKGMKRQVKALEKTIEKLENDLINSPAEIEQLQIWLEEIRVAFCAMLHKSSGEGRVQPNEESEPNELAELLQEIKEKCKRAEAWENQVDDLKKQLEESNLDHYLRENETLKEYLAKAQADLDKARAPVGPLKSDPKVRQIINLKQRVAELESQVNQSQASPSAGKDINRVKELEDELAATKKALTDCHEHRNEMDDRILHLEKELRDALNVSEGNTDPTAQEKIRSLTVELDDAKVALGNSRTEAEQMKTKNGELDAQVSQLKKENDLKLISGSDDGATAVRLQQERDAAQSETSRIRDQATRDTQQAQIEKQQLCAEATEKLQQAELRIQTLQNATDPSNQNGEIKRLRTINNDLITAQKDLEGKLAHAHGAWDHFSKAASNAKSERSALETILNAERVQTQEVTAASFSKDNELKQLRTLLANAKKLEAEALAHLHGEGKTIIGGLQQQLSTALQERATAVNAHASLQLRLTDLQRERDAAVQTLLTDNTNNAAAVENTTLRQQVTDLQRRLQDNNHANSQIDELTRSVNAKEQIIQGLNSKYSGYGTKTTAAMVPQKRYDDLSRENILVREELNRLHDWKNKTESPGAASLTEQLKQEQIRRVKADDRYNKVFPQIDALRKKLRECEDRHTEQAQPTSTTAGANLNQVIQLNSTLRGEIHRNNERYHRLLAELGTERDRLLQRLADIQRGGGQTDLADCTQALREAKEKNAELQKWRDDHEFMVQQADTFAAAERAIAAARGDVQRARDDAMGAGFTGVRGVVRKKGDGGEEESPPRRDAKVTKREGEGGDLFEGPVDG